MSTARCPCGANFEGDPDEVNRAYDRHDCMYHKGNAISGFDWMIVIVLALLAAAGLCALGHGWGMFG